MPRTVAQHHVLHNENPRMVQTLGWIIILCLIGSLFTIYRALKPPSMQEQLQGQAYVTYVSNEDEVAGAVVLAHSLRQTHTPRQLVVMVPEEGVGPAAREELEQAAHRVVEVKRVITDGSANSSMVPGTDFTRLMVWSLHLDKVVFLAPSCLVLRSIDSLFSVAPFAAVFDCCDRFDPGVFVAVPNLKTLANMLEKVKRLAMERVTLEDFLNDYFEGQWNSLPFVFNAQQKHLRQLSPKARKMDSVRVLQYNHFPKPWQSRDLQEEGILDDLYTPWWKAYDSMLMERQEIQKQQDE